jgi:hypothetical protein
MLRTLLIGMALSSGGLAGAQPSRDAEKGPRPPPPSDRPESPGRADIAAAMQKVKPAMIACGQKHSVKGTVKLKIRINPKGTVELVEVVQTPDAKANDCMVGVAKTITMRASESGVTFSYPIVF